MFETLFTYPKGVCRHRDGPLADERVAYLAKRAAQGVAHATSRKLEAVSGWPSSLTTGPLITVSALMRSGRWLPVTRRGAGSNRAGMPVTISGPRPLIGSGILAIFDQNPPACRPVTK